MTRAERSIQSLPSDKARIENDFIYFFLSSLPYTSVSSLPDAEAVQLPATAPPALTEDMWCEEVLVLFDHLGGGRCSRLLGFLGDLLTYSLNCTLTVTLFSRRLPSAPLAVSLSVSTVSQFQKAIGFRITPSSDSSFIHVPPSLSQFINAPLSCLVLTLLSKRVAIGLFPVAAEATIITTQPTTLDITVGESVVLPCQVSHDPSLELKFTWFFNEQLIHFGSNGGFFEKVGGQHSAGDIMIRNIQLGHAGKYTCAVQTKVDSISIAVDLVVRGPPGPPTSIQVEEITDTTASLSWRPGPDNHSPITAYTIQARTPFSLGWQAVTTVPEVVGGHQLTAAVTELSPWVEYEFRVLASNRVGTGEPSKPSKQARTKSTTPKVTPANVSGGGGSRSELVITWEPVPEELQNGPGFGYVVAFRPHGATGWMQAAVPSPEASRYVFKNESIQPFSPFHVKVGVYNNEGEGPFGPVTTIYSAEEEPGRAPTRIRAKSLSASEMEVSWKALPWNISKRRVLGYEQKAFRVRSPSAPCSALFAFQLRYWSRSEREETASVQRTSGNQTSSVIGGLRGSTVYHISVRAYNTAGTGPPSTTVNENNVASSLVAPSQPPVKVMWNTSNSKIILNWEHVKALENESEVTGYKVSTSLSHFIRKFFLLPWRAQLPTYSHLQVLYKKNRHSRPSVMETNTTSVELALPTDEDYIIQIKPFGEGGDGSSSKQITIPKIPGPNAVGSASKVSTLSALSTIALSFTARTSL
ncbi:hypothetical protein CCH79_00016469 [Gambusia affinis]|uniref:Contactin 4 n=1 Tax=Gambusia affinis TaxID=33528 RepID=A0A315VKA6_GAMAF|nr:hypothetical protein CCH79_00016469 [Gambusia affinis]